MSTFTPLEPETNTVRTPASARQKRRVAEDQEAGSRTPASARDDILHDFGDRGFYDHNDVRNNDNDVSADQDLDRREDAVRTELFQEEARRPLPMQPEPDVRRRRQPPHHGRTRERRRHPPVLEDEEGL